MACHCGFRVVSASTLLSFASKAMSRLYTNIHSAMEIGISTHQMFVVLLAVLNTVHMLHISIVLSQSTKGRRKLRFPSDHLYISCEPTDLSSMVVDHMRIAVVGCFVVFVAEDDRW